MKKTYYLAIDDLEKPQLQWTGFLVAVEGGTSGGKNRAIALVEELWENDQLPLQCFRNGFSEDNLIMAKVRKDTDRELLPIEEAGNYLIELIELVAQKLQAQEDYRAIAPMVQKVFLGKEAELTTEEIEQALDTKTVRNILGQLTRTIAEVELSRQKCQEYEDLIMGIIQIGDQGEVIVRSPQTVIEEAKPANTPVNKTKKGKVNPANSNIDEETEL